MGSLFPAGGNNVPFVTVTEEEIVGAVVPYGLLVPKKSSTRTGERPDDENGPLFPSAQRLASVSVLLHLNFH
jgi:hypothetical protein